MRGRATARSPPVSPAGGCWARGRTGGDFAQRGGLFVGGCRGTSDSRRSARARALDRGAVAERLHGLPVCQVGLGQRPWSRCHRPQLPVTSSRARSTPTPQFSLRPPGRSPRRSSDGRAASSPIARRRGGRSRPAAAGAADAAPAAGVAVERLVLAGAAHGAAGVAAAPPPSAPTQLPQFSPSSARRRRCRARRGRLPAQQHRRDLDAPAISTRPARSRRPRATRARRRGFAAAAARAPRPRRGGGRRAAAERGRRARAQWAQQREAAAHAPAARGRTNPGPRRASTRGVIAALAGDVDVRRSTLGVVAKAASLDLVDARRAPLLPRTSACKGGAAHRRARRAAGPASSSPRTG